MPNSRYALAFIVAGITFSSASAATFTVAGFKDEIIVSLNGEIAEGDSIQLKELIKASNDVGRSVSSVHFNSPGGNLLEGVKLAAIIRYGKFSTVVANGARCASACFVAFAAGSQKFVGYTAGIGVHGASDRLGREAGDATVSAARIVKELGVPDAIIGKMVVTRATEIVWLSPDDLRSMGVSMIGRPAQIAPEVARRTGQFLEPPDRNYLPLSTQENLRPPSAPVPRAMPAPRPPSPCPAQQAFEARQDAYYKAKMDQLAKQMYKEYPGYKAYIDRTLAREFASNNSTREYLRALTRAELIKEGACAP
jgi:ATP-dependent protease ClpP protease subunit